MSDSRKTVVLCQYCEQREATRTRSVPTVVDADTFGDVEVHLRLTLEQDQRHQAMAFRDFVPGLLARITELEAQVAETQAKANAYDNKRIVGYLVLNVFYPCDGVPPQSGVPTPLAHARGYPVGMPLV